MCPTEDLFSGLRPGQAEAHSGDTIWSNNGLFVAKLLKIIEEWKRSKKLSPVFIAQISEEGPQIFGGHHRITVAHWINAEQVAFVVPDLQPTWVLTSFPKSKFVCEIVRKDMDRILKTNGTPF